MQPIALKSTWYYRVESRQATIPLTPDHWQGWQPISLPHRAPLEASQAGWYATTFEMPPNDECSVWWLEAQGIYHACRLWINGQEVGAHWGGFTRFRMEITDIVQMETNLLVIQVEPSEPPLYTTLKTGLVPLQAAPTPAYGIWGSIRIMPYDCMQPPHTDDWYSPSARPALQVDASTGEWWQDGSLFFPRGCTYLPTPHTDDRTWEAHVEIAKKASINILRVAGHILPDAFYDLCDEEGMFIWQDFPFNLDEIPLSQLEQALKEMVCQLRRHPCIVAWGLHTRQGGEVSRKLADLITQLDPLRHVEIQSPDFFYEPIREAKLGTHDSIPLAFGFPSLPSTLPHDPNAMARLEAWRNELDRSWLLPSKLATLPQAIEYTQEKQATLVKYAVEQYRLHKTSSTVGVFHHTLADSVTSLSPSLIDEQGNPKPAYTAIQLVMRPVLPIADMPLAWLSEAPLGKELVMSIALVNDMPRRIEGWNCNISMTGWLPSSQSPDEKTFMFHWKHIFQHITVAASSVMIVGQITIPPLTRKAPMYQLVIQFYNLYDEIAQAAVNTYLLPTAHA